MNVYLRVCKQSGAVLYWKLLELFFSIKLTFSWVHMFRSLVLCLSVKILENSLQCFPPFPLCLTSFSLSNRKFISYWLKPWRGFAGIEVNANLVQCAKCHNDTLESSAISQLTGAVILLTGLLFDLTMTSIENLLLQTHLNQTTIALNPTSTFQSLSLLPYTGLLGTLLTLTAHHLLLNFPVFQSFHLLKMQTSSVTFCALY